APQGRGQRRSFRWCHSPGKKFALSPRDLVAKRLGRAFAGLAGERILVGREVAFEGCLVDQLVEAGEVREQQASVVAPAPADERAAVVDRFLHAFDGAL